MTQGSLFNDVRGNFIGIVTKPWLYQWNRRIQIAFYKINNPGHLIGMRNRHELIPQRPSSFLFHIFGCITFCPGSCNRTPLNKFTLKSVSECYKVWRQQYVIFLLTVNLIYIFLLYLIPVTSIVFAFVIIIISIEFIEHYYYSSLESPYCTLSAFFTTILYPIAFVHLCFHLLPTVFVCIFV